MENSEAKWQKINKPFPGYHCPLCPDHDDSIFVWSPILKVLICEGCDYELWDAVVCEEKRLPDSFILNLLEQHTNLSFDEYRLIEINHTVQILAENSEVDVVQLSHLKCEITRLQSLLKKEK